MKILFAKLLGALTLLLAVSFTALAATHWDDDYDKAVAKAKAEKKTNDFA